LCFELLISLFAPFDFLDDVIAQAVDDNAVFYPVRSHPSNANGVGMFRDLLNADARVVPGLLRAPALRFHREGDQIVTISRNAKIRRALAG